jgi:hypothetical protein
MKAIAALGLAASIVACGSAASAQAPRSRELGLLNDPCASVPPPPQALTDFLGALAKVRASGTPDPALSPADLAKIGEWQKATAVADPFAACKYDAANKALAARSRERVVFMGDSITEPWLASRPDFLRGDRVDRGISGETTSEMLVRFTPT